MGWQVETDWLYPMLPEGHNRHTDTRYFRWRWLALLYTVALYSPIPPRPLGIPLQSRVTAATPTPERAGRE